jgi:iron complex transport system ATP-binding protein
MTPSPLLRFADITYGYPATLHPVMEAFNLDIEQGTVTAILGPNGAGKTTLLHLALGWLRPQAGQVLLEGKLLSSYGRRHIGQSIGLVPQNEHVAFEYSLLEYVLLGRAPYLQPLAMPNEGDYRIAYEALQEVGMADLQNRSVLSLSGGEIQLVMVARALTQQPRLMLLDEPTSHLDLSNKGRLVHLLQRLASHGVTILFTTHEPDIASNLATHLVLMQKGQVLHTGTMDEVFTTEALSQLYQIPLKVEQIDHQKVVLWK